VSAVPERALPQDAVVPGSAGGPRATGDADGLAAAAAAIRIMLLGRFAVLRGVQEIPLHWEGVAGLPRRVANYPYLPGYVTTLNKISSIGSFVLGVSTLFFLYNVYWTWRFEKQVTEDDPWGLANSLEWATSCPPPRHNFTHIPGSGPNGPPSTCTTRTSAPAGLQHAPAVTRAPLSRPG
jgi:heme/copper-type cytochrome/quinol oxidase subunit 1